MRKIKKIKGLRGDVLEYVAQGIPQIDAEIAEKGHLWMETRLMPFNGTSRPPRWENTERTGKGGALVQMDKAGNKNIPTVNIAVPLPVRGTFSYRLPLHLARRATVGCQALVSFNHRLTYGYILELGSASKDRDLKEVLDIPEPVPLFHQNLVPFLKWISEYYLYPIGKVIESALPSGVGKRISKAAALTAAGRGVLKHLALEGEEREILRWVEAHPGRRPPWPLDRLHRLEKKGWIVLRERHRRRRTGPLMRKFVKIRDEQDLSRAVRGEFGALTLPHEVDFLGKMMQEGPLLASELSRGFPNGAYLIEKWVKRGVLETFRGPVYRDPFGKVASLSPVPPHLFDQQRQAVLQIQRSLETKGFTPYLLYGITGSGKSEVYYRAIEYAVRLGRQSIVLVPEIALANYLEGLFRSRLGDRVAIYHSGLSEGERYDQWTRMIWGEVDMVIGARSALFAPFSRLGLIVVDEEHDSTYKQEKDLRYQARDAAVMRAKMENAVIVLGSGTPSVQSFENQLSGRYQLLFMPHRVESRPLPEVEIVDMKSQQDDGQGDQILSPRLEQALIETVEEGNQAILFLNRRGYHRVFLCRSCGQSIRCPNCDVALTYHRGPNLLICHYCGYRQGTEKTCPSCGKADLKTYGFGTERLEHELAELFPEASIARMDTDSTRRKGKAFQILRGFSEHETDILVGTQMITKGYDFPRVTLVGVIDADLSLAFPDFRAGERTFQILAQVAGRAGRGDKKGRVIIQAFNPGHYAIAAATAHDYPSFFEQERALRSQLGYPPFSHLSCLRIQGNGKRKTEEAAQWLGGELRAILKKWPKKGKEVSVLGPTEAPVTRIKGKYRWQILVKSRNSALLRHFLERAEVLLRPPLQSHGVQFILDVDPYSMI